MPIVKLNIAGLLIYIAFFFAILTFWLTIGRNGILRQDKRAQYVCLAIVLYTLFMALQILDSIHLDLNNYAKYVKHLCAILGSWYVTRACCLSKAVRVPKWVNLGTFASLLWLSLGIILIEFKIASFDKLLWRAVLLIWLIWLLRWPLFGFADLYVESDLLINKWRFLSYFLCILFATLYLLLKLLLPLTAAHISSLVYCLISLFALVGFLPHQFYLLVLKGYYLIKGLKDLILLRHLRQQLSITPLFDHPVPVVEYLTHTRYHLRRECITILDSYKLIKVDTLTTWQQAILQAIRALPSDLEEQELLDECLRISRRFSTNPIFYLI